MTTPATLSAQQRSSIRATARHEWMVTRDAGVAIVATQLVVQGFVASEQIATAHDYARGLIRWWKKHGIDSPDACPMEGEPGWVMEEEAKP